VKRTIVLFAWAAVGCSVDLNRMIDQHKYEAYEASSAFANGQVMRTPPTGTVPYDAELRPAEVVSGQRDRHFVDRLPLEVDAALLARGENRFRIFCQTCHGPLADGQSDVARVMRLRRPPSLHEERIRELPAGQLFRVIGEGYGLMPSYGAQLGYEDRWAVVAYVQALQLSQNVALAELPSALRQEATPWLR
jgi:mono/diheme cytochrome c family protein